MVFPMNEMFHFSQQLSRSQFTRSRWQRIGPFPSKCRSGSESIPEPILSAASIWNFPKIDLYRFPESKLRSKTPAQKSNRKTQIKASERELKTCKANPRSNLEPSFTIGSSDGRTLECRCWYPWSEGKIRPFANLMK
jgi:hypothetical protein